MTSIDRITGRAVPLRGQDIDTDRIIPARFLKAVTFDGLERHLFEDDRRAASARGATHPLDDPARRGARVLIANGNFGCGSSREHAPQALARLGIGAVVAESFAEIFSGNALAIGLACVTVSPEDAGRLMALADTHPAEEFVVDIREERVSAADVRVALTMPPGARDALLSGHWDATGLLLERYEDVERAAGRLPYLRFGEATRE